MHIAITGNLGSGKSTICSLMQREYGYEVYSTGKIIREFAEKLGVTTLEMNHLMDQDNKYDHMIDDEVARISRERGDESILFDSRLAWHFAENAFKVFLLVDAGIAAARVLKDGMRGEVEAYGSLEEAREKLTARADAENRRYQAIYNVDYFDFSNYHLIVDTSNCPPQQVAALIMECAAAWEKDPSSYSCRVFLSPQNLFPTIPLSGIDGSRIQGLIPTDAVYGMAPIEVAKYKTHYFILDDHHAAVAAAKTHLPLVPVTLAATLPNLDRITRRDLAAYEDYAGFCYPCYPDCIPK